MNAEAATADKMPARDAGRRLAWHERLIAWTIGRLIRAYAMTIAWSSKIEAPGLHHLDAAVASGRPVILAAWHGSVISLCVMRVARCFPRLLMLSSQSRDGEYGIAVVRALGFDSVRGSSSRGGAMGLIRLKRRMQQSARSGEPLITVHALDASKGPRHAAKPGALVLARKTDALIVPVVTGLSRRFVARSWDRLRIPLPFGRCVFCFGEPIDIGRWEAERRRELGEEAEKIEFKTEDLEQIMFELSQHDPLCAADYYA